jgi:hypothetical protein
MIKIDEDKTIHVTRGDATNDINKLVVSQEGVSFSQNDKLKLIVVKKKGYTSSIVFSKEQTITDAGDEVEFELTSTDTSGFPLENTKKEYWYDFVLNGDTTILGYDEDNAKKFIVYPGGLDE